MVRSKQISSCLSIQKWKRLTEVSPSLAPSSHVPNKKTLGEYIKNKEQIQRPTAFKKKKKGLVRPVKSVVSSSRQSSSRVFLVLSILPILPLAPSDCSSSCAINKHPNTRVEAHTIFKEKRKKRIIKEREKNSSSPNWKPKSSSSIANSQSQRQCARTTLGFLRLLLMQIVACAHTPDAP